MSVLSLALTNGFTFPKSASPQHQALYITKQVMKPVTGRAVKEVEINNNKEKGLIQCPIQILSKKTHDEARSPRSAHSTVASPMLSPQPTNRFAFSPTNRRFESPSSPGTMPTSCKRFSELSPRPEIGELVKNSLQQLKSQQKASKKQHEIELKTKLQKKMQLKLLDKMIREENFSKFKQKACSPRPKWGGDEKIAFKAAKVLKKSKTSPRPCQAAQRVKKRKGNKKTREITGSEVNLIKHKEEIFNQISQLGERVSNLRNTTVKNESRTELTLSLCQQRKQSVTKILGIYSKLTLKFYFNQIKCKNHNALLINNPIILPSQSEDEEVRKILENPIRKKITKHIEEPKIIAHDKYLSESQLRFKLAQQQQLNELRNTDAIEMRKLAEDLGGSPDLKDTFQSLIDKRYLILENIFKQASDIFLQSEDSEIKKISSEDAPLSSSNKKQDLSYSENKDVIEFEDYALPSLRNTISEFSSSFLMQLKAVPENPANLSLEAAQREENEYIDSPSEGSILSHESFSEPEDLPFTFPNINKFNSLILAQDEPNHPFLGDSLGLSIKPQESSEENALIGLVHQIRAQDIEVIENPSQDTIDFKESKLRPNPVGAIYIVEESFSSYESGEPPEYSTIVASPLPEAESLNEGSFPDFERQSEIQFFKPEKNLESLSFSSSVIEVKDRKIIIENFPKQESKNFANALETSSEADGFDLLTNRVIFTLELDTFTFLLESALSDLDFWLIPRPRPTISIRKPSTSSDHFAQTDTASILSLIHKLHSQIPSNSIHQHLSNLYSPLSFLIKAQDSSQPLHLPFLFTYEDLEKSSSFLSSSISVSTINPFNSTHSKMVVDAFNEAIFKCVRRRVGEPWDLVDWIGEAECEDLIKKSVKKVEMWSRLEAGKIPEERMLDESGQVDERVLQSVRQERLGKLIISDVAEEDLEWKECDIQENQTALSLADNILQDLLIEAFNIMNT